MRLFTVELDRFRSRRSSRFAVLGIFLIVWMVVYGAWSASKPYSAAEIAQAQASYDEQVEWWDEFGEEQIADCLALEATEQETNPGVDYQCDQMAPGGIENWLGGKEPFSDKAAAILPSFGLMLVLAAFAMGVTFVAAEFSSGAIGNWLTFEPRRTRVYASKVAAAGVSVVPVALVMGALVVGGTWLAYSIHENLGTVTGETWADIGASGARLTLLAAGFAMLGVALGTLVRHSAAALGLLAGYAILEQMVAGLFSWTQPKTLQMNFQAVLDNGAVYWTEVCEITAAGRQCTSVEKTLSLTHGAVTLSVVLVVLVVAAALVFRRRDVN